MIYVNILDSKISIIIRNNINIGDFKVSTRAIYIYTSKTI